MTRGNCLVAGFSAFLFLGDVMAAGAQAPAPEATPRGIYLAGSTLGVSAEIEIERDGKRGLVPPTFEFRSGDRFWLQVITNRDAYIYVLNRTIKGDPQSAASRGIKLMQQEDLKRPAPDAYTMIYPAPNTTAAIVKAHVTTRIPAGNQYFMMDEVIGAEKVMIIAADRPSDITRYFDRATGKLAVAGNSADSSSSVLNRLNTELSTMADNTRTQEGSRAIRIDPLPGQPAAAKPAPAPQPVPPPPPPPTPKPAPAPEKAKSERPTTSVPKDPGKPLLQELTLVHVAR